MTLCGKNPSKRFRDSKGGGGGEGCGREEVVGKSLFWGGVNGVPCSPCLIPDTDGGGVAWGSRIASFFSTARCVHLTDVKQDRVTERLSLPLYILHVALQEEPAILVGPPPVIYVFFQHRRVGSTGTDFVSHHVLTRLNLHTSDRTQRRCDRGILVLRLCPVQHLCPQALVERAQRPTDAQAPPAVREKAVLPIACVAPRHHPCAQAARQPRIRDKRHVHLQQARETEGFLRVHACPTHQAPARKHREPRNADDGALCAAHPHSNLQKAFPRLVPPHFAEVDVVQVYACNRAARGGHHRIEQAVRFDPCPQRRLRQRRQARRRRRRLQRPRHTTCHTVLDLQHFQRQRVDAAPPGADLRRTLEPFVRQRHDRKLARHTLQLRHPHVVCYDVFQTLRQPLLVVHLTQHR
eukprot:Rhum_TRINITY_DN7042_c0_g1::Rhum_TRINITY_DN7042_c0_g1_i1::g.21454::m.21454